MKPEIEAKTKKQPVGALGSQRQLKQLKYNTLDSFIHHSHCTKILGGNDFGIYVAQC